MFARRPTLRSTLAVALCAMALVFCGCGGTKSVPEGIPSAVSAAAPLLNTVTAAVPGLSQTQAILGAGSLFGLAKAKMPADQFSQIEAAVPGADALASEAASKGLPNTTSSLSEVTKFLDKHGVPPAMTGQLVPAVGDFVKSKVSPELGNAFMAALS